MTAAIEAAGDGPARSKRRRSKLQSRHDGTLSGADFAHGFLNVRAALPIYLLFWTYLTPWPRLCGKASQLICFYS